MKNQTFHYLFLAIATAKTKIQATNKNPKVKLKHDLLRHKKKNWWITWTLLEDPNI